MTKGMAVTAVLLTALALSGCRTGGGGDEFSEGYDIGYEEGYWDCYNGLSGGGWTEGSEDYQEGYNAGYLAGCMVGGEEAGTTTPAETIWVAQCVVLCDGQQTTFEAAVCWDSEDDPQAVAEEGVDECTADLSNYCHLVSCQCTVIVTEEGC